MKAKTVLSLLGLAAGAMLAVVLLLAGTGRTGEYHSGSKLICFDCHTMHFSQAQGNTSTDPFGTGSPVQVGLAGGPNAFLLRQPGPNQLCLACHTGQTFAPVVQGTNTNTAPTEGRQAGALTTGAAPYENWKGHTLDSTDAPPGYNPSLVGIANATWYDNTQGLECINCHAQHGPATAYRNLGPYALGGSASNFRPTYVISTTNDPTKDVWINIPTGYAAGSGNAATFNDYYSRAKIFFNRIDATVGSVKTSNKLASFCATCHANFHGGPGNANIGADPGTLDGFIRHPTAQVTIGAAGAQGYGGHSSLSRYTGATNKIKVLTTDYTGYTDASPFCLSCHKAHGNQNPFGLIFMARSGGTISEEGTETDPKVGIRNLCGQCHGQGN